MQVRGIRGAITVIENTSEAILAGTRELLEGILKSNPSLDTSDIASALFTVTDDLNGAFPAQAARELGWVGVPMLCFREIPVPESLPMCIRILIHWNTGKSQDGIHHVYLEDASSLRPDLKESVS
jgi:chorismate mutase